LATETKFQRVHQNALQHSPDRVRIIDMRPRRKYRRIAPALVTAALLAGCSLIGESPAPAPRPSPADVSSGVIRAVPVDGGPQFYRRFAGFPTSASFFPIGVWFESVTSPGDVDTDRQAGLNTYLALTANSDFSLVRRVGSLVIGQAEEWTKAVGAGPTGWLLGDEVDMSAGPEKGLEQLRAAAAGLPEGDRRLRYANYGKGVTFWESEEAAARFVNFPDVVSADNYWFTDRNLCGAGEGGRLLADGRALPPDRCHLAANYGKTVQRLRTLVAPAGSRPVWNFVEVGHPAGEAAWPTIAPDQVRAAVWSGLINGARGVVYFNHSFGGPAPTQHALREPAYARVRSMVTTVNRQITRLAPVLNSPTITGAVRTDGAVDTLVKFAGRDLYVFAGSTRAPGQSVTFDLPCAASAAAAKVTVIGENRSLPLQIGRFSDRFADGNDVHLYRMRRPAACRVG
jgi:hypothetical protein